MTIQSNFPNVAPSLMLDFANMGQLDPRVTFYRGTPAVYYNASTTAVAEQNLITNSQVFNGAPWVNVDNTTFNTSQTAPDGTSTATKLIPNTSNALHRIFTNTVASNNATTTWTISIYAKADGYNYLGIFINGPDKGVLYNLSAGTASDTPFSPYTGATYSITSIGNSWYRCVITVTGTSIANFQLQLWNNTPAQSYAGDGTSGVIIWGAQVEARSTATPYTPTTTQPITNYIPVLLTAGGGQARFDHNPTTKESLGLLFEEQRTNNFAYSQQLDQWNPSNYGVTTNTIIAPDGTLTGDKIIPNSGAGNGYIGQYFTGTAGSIVMTGYFKAGQNRRVSLWEGNVSAYYATFDLISGTVVQTNGATGIITAVGNGWYRCSMISTQTSGTRYWLISVLADSATSPFSTGITGNAFNGLYGWGLQLELGEFATSYIETTSAAATRLRDYAIMNQGNFSNWFNSSEGTIYSDATPTATNAQSKGIYTFFNANLNNSINLYTYGSTLYADVYSAGLVANLSGTYSSSKTSLGYKLNNVNIANGNVLGTADTSCDVAFIPNTLFIGNTYAGSSYPFTGWIKKLAYYSVRITDVQLQALNT